MFISEARSTLAPPRSVSSTLASYTSTPLIFRAARQVIWLHPRFERKVPKTGFYKCPVYKVLTRWGMLSTTGHSTNFVVFIEVPSNVDQRKWIKSGVALFCALKYIYR